MGTRIRTLKPEFWEDERLDAGLVVRYQAGGDTFVWGKKFTIHQKIDKPTPSKPPPPPGFVAESPLRSPRAVVEASSPDGNGVEGNGRDRERSGAEAERSGKAAEGTDLAALGFDAAFAPEA